MPRNGFAFPIRVSCEVDVFSFFGTGNDGIDVFAVAADQLVFHGKAIVRTDRSAFRNQIADMTVRRQDFKITAQIFFRVLALDGDYRRLIGFSPLLFSLDGLFMFQTALLLRPSGKGLVHHVLSGQRTHQVVAYQDG